MKKTILKKILSRGFLIDTLVICIFLLGVLSVSSQVTASLIQGKPWWSNISVVKSSRVALGVSPAIDTPIVITVKVPDTILIQNSHKIHDTFIKSEVIYHEKIVYKEKEVSSDSFYISRVISFREGGQIKYKVVLQRDGSLNTTDTLLLPMVYKIDQVGIQIR